VADEVLGAGYHVTVAVAHGGNGHRADVRARFRLGHRDAVVPFAPDRRQQIALPLFLLACLEDVAGPLDQHLQRVAGPAKLSLHQDKTNRVQPASAELGGHVRGVQAGRDGLLADGAGDLARYFIEPLHLVFVRVELPFDEVVHGRGDQPLLVGEAEIHRGHRPSRRMTWPT